MSKSKKSTWGGPGRGGGRKPKPVEEKNEYRLLGMLPGEWEKVEAIALAAGESNTEIIRRAVRAL